MKKSGKSTRRGLTVRQSGAAPLPSGDRLLTDVRALIDAARGHVALAVNAGLVALYWHVGDGFYRRCWAGGSL